MQELSLHILDIAQNSLSAGAKHIGVSIAENSNDDTLKIGITDDGCGMTPEQVERVRNPFYTTRTTRKVGMGISLLEMAAKQTGGGLELDSEKGKGTSIRVTMGLSHIDRMPMGNLCETVITLIGMNPAVDWKITYSVDTREYALDTAELRQVLEEVPLNEPSVLTWIKESVQDGLNELHCRA